MLHRISKSLKSPLIVSKGSAILLGLLVVVLLAANIALLLQNQNLKSRTADSASPLTVKIGTVVPKLSGFDIYGKEFTLDYASDSRKAILLIFSPDCTFCTRNMPNWSKIAYRINRKLFRLVAVSTVSKGAKEYWENNGFDDIAVISEIDPKIKSDYNTNITPQTLLIGSDGRVERVWIGVIGDRWPELEQALSLSSSEASN